MKNIFCSLAGLIICVSAFCSNPDSTVKKNEAFSKPLRTKVYHINYFVEGSIILVGMTGDLFAIPRLKSKPTISDSELVFANSNRQRDLINTFDRWSLRQPTSDRKLWQNISDDGEIGIFLLPSLLMIDKNIRKDWLHILFMYVEGHTITFTVYNYSPLGPWFQNRYRPAVYYSELSNSDRENPNNRNSFYSGHTASCAYTTFFMVKVYCDYHPEIGALKYLLYLAASVPPLAIGYARIRSLDHFPSDVAVGFGLGAILGIVVPAIHKYPFSKHISLGLCSSPDEVGVSICWKLSDKHIFTPVN
jgi:membrane-associated phospholipid phosphatase